MMRRSQSLRNHTSRAAPTVVADDLGVLTETPEDSGETDWKALYLQEKRLKEEAIRERDEGKSKYTVLMEEYQALRKENKSNEILLQGTQKENIKCMSDMNRMNTQLQKYERQLEHLAGPNWRINLDLPNMTSSHEHTAVDDSQLDPASPEAAMAQVEKVRLLIIGMEERLQMREEKLLQNIKKAEAEGTKFEELRKHVMTTMD
ncbi:unnamed protein product [Somion occarium]|uniref:Uncharacterized protein n=1 Tax=Somion occarium TaxID=3059160 RepID=A0ABP1CGF8_9APHY